MIKNVPTGEIDERDQEIMQTVEMPLNLNDVEITVFALPEVAE